MPAWRTIMMPGRAGLGDGPARRGHRAAQQLDELVHPQVPLLSRLGRVPEQPRIQLLGHHRVLDPVHQPVDHGDDHPRIDVLADLTPGDAGADEAVRAVRVLARQELGDFAAQLQSRAVVADQGDPVRDPVLVDEVRGGVDPVPQDREEPLRAHLRRRVQVGREGPGRSLVSGQEQAGLGLEVPEHRPLGHARLAGDLLDAGRLVAARGEVLHGHRDDPLLPGALALGSPAARPDGSSLTSSHLVTHSSSLTSARQANHTSKDPTS